MKYTYKDFETGKPRYTRGRFVGWQQGGPLNAKYALFKCPSTVLAVPRYCLTAESLAAIEEAEAERKRIAESMGIATA